MSRDTGRRAHLDGLRGLAALIVVFAHYVLAFQPRMYFPPPGVAPGTPGFSGASWIARTPLIAAFSPQFAVAVFFVLSGFVLAASVTAKPAPLPELAVRRWLRLSLPVLLTTLPIWLWLTTGWHPDTALAARTHSQWLGMNFTWVAWQANSLPLAMFQALFDVYARGRHWWNTALWTIQIELWGSLALFAGYAAMRRLRLGRGRRLLAAALASALLCRSDYGGFAIGALLFELEPALQAALARRRVLGWPLGLALFVLALLLGGAPYSATGWTPYVGAGLWLAAHTGGDPILDMHRAGAALAVAAALSWTPLQALLTTRPFAFLGRVSFTMYLVHVSLICTVAAWVVLRTTPLLGYNAATLMGLPALLAVLLPLAALGTRWIDRPGIALALRAGRLAGALRPGWRQPALSAGTAAAAAPAPAASSAPPVRAR